MSDKPALPERRWYCVSRDGFATLCTDESDALVTAAQCDHDWRASSPHRAVQLIDASALATQAEAHAAELAQWKAAWESSMQFARDKEIELTEARKQLSASCAIRAQLEAEREAHAKRYRWLRDVSVPPHNFYLSVPIEFDGVRYTPQEVDAAIDAAIDAARTGSKP